MTSRTARIILSVIMLLSLLIVLLSAIGLLDAGNPDNETDQGSTAQTSSSEPVRTSGTTVANPRELAISMVDPEPTPALGLRRWPAVPCLEKIHEADLAALVGRPADQRPLSGITVILDPGHGGTDGGSSYPSGSADPEIVEKDIALAVSLKARDILTGMGAEVVMTRDADTWQSVYNRIAAASLHVVDRFLGELPYKGYTCQQAEGLVPQLEAMIDINSDSEESGGRGLLNGLGATADARLLLDIEQQYPDVLFISLHCNALGDGTEYGGLQVYYQTNESNYLKETSYVQYQDSGTHPPVYSLYDDQDRQALAQLLRDNILRQIPDLAYQGSSDVLTGDFATLREMNLVSILVEMGFVTSPTDRRILLDSNKQQMIAQGVADAVYAYYCSER